MSFVEIISSWSLPIALLLVLGFSFWKFWIQPRMNEGMPIEPSKDFDKEKSHSPSDFI